jgi:putative transport protein
VVGFAFGRYVLKMNSVLLLGALAGAQTSTPALVAVQAASGSHVAVLGYTTPYAASTLLLTFGGALMIALMT